MKKFITILIAILLLLSSMTVSAETDYAYNVSLCYDGDAYSVDYVFSVPDGVEFLSVSVSDANCFYDWNYIKSEARLYISLASGSIIPLSKTIITLSLSAENVFLEPISVTINGNIKSDVYAYHNPIPMEQVAAGVEKPGLGGGEMCSNCGIVLKEHDVVAPTGPIVSAVLTSDKSLNVSGSISDDKLTDGTTLLAIYNEDGRMLGIKDITQLDQSNFSILIKNMENAYSVKILRWNLTNIIPLKDTVDIMVNSCSL